MCLVGTDKPTYLDQGEPLSEGLMCTYLIVCRPVKPDPHLGAFSLACHSVRDTAIQDVATSYEHGGISTRGCKSRSKSGVTRTLERDIQTVREDKVQVVSDYGSQNIGYTGQVVKTARFDERWGDGKHCR